MAFYLLSQGRLWLHKQFTAWGRGSPFVYYTRPNCGLIVAELPSVVPEIRSVSRYWIKLLVSVSIQWHIQNDSLVAWVFQKTPSEQLRTLPYNTREWSCSALGGLCALSNSCSRKLRDIVVCSSFHEPELQGCQYSNFIFLSNNPLFYFSRLNRPYSFHWFIWFQYVPLPNMHSEQYTNSK